MLCYKDKTFCKDEKCKDFKTCPDAYTDAVKEAAKNFGLPVSVCARKCKEERNVLFF